MTLTDLIQTFKDSVAQANLQMELTAEYCVVCLSLALACALIIMLTYRLFYRGACYSANFNILLAMTALVTTTIIMTISANIVLSLGMVGALSIVRFRAAVKDPLDVGFLFWSVAVGITCGAGLYLFALMGTLFLALVYIVLQLLRGRARTHLIITRYREKAAEQVESVLHTAHARIRSRTVSGETTEVTAAVFFLFRQRDLDKTIGAIEGVEHVMMVEYTGDI
ncbi:MAG: DUF4956 domain-containing protein [Clostridia bacterium]|nr:DUF4956 domain-containing protein [Clostridia bacterium]